jgi:hypothetical protein
MGGLGMSDGLGSGLGAGIAAGTPWDPVAKADEIYAAFERKCMEQPLTWGRTLTVIGSGMAGAELANAYRPERFRAAFEPWVDGDPNAASAMYDLLGKALDAYERDQGDPITDVRLAVNGWTGHAAREFKDYFGELETALLLQKDLIRTLQNIVRAQHDLMVKARDDLLTIADGTLQAMESVEPSGGVSPWAAVFTAVGVVAGVIAAIPSAGTSLTVTAASVSGLSGVAASGLATVQGTGPTGATVAGTDPFEIADSMFKALEDLDEAVSLETRKLTASLNGMLQWLDDPSNLREILPRRPELPVGPSTFHLPGDGHGRR